MYFDIREHHSPRIMGSRLKSYRASVPVDLWPWFFMLFDIVHMNDLTVMHHEFKLRICSRACYWIKIPELNLHKVSLYNCNLKQFGNKDGPPLQLLSEQYVWSLKLAPIFDLYYQVIQAVSYAAFSSKLLIFIALHSKKDKTSEPWCEPTNLAIHPTHSTKWQSFCNQYLFYDLIMITVGKRKCV